MSTRYMSQTTALAALVIFDQPVYMWSEERGRAEWYSRMIINRINSGVSCNANKPVLISLQA
ncbi:hypothetical protein GYMLUDRAFT_48863 [Collybiopsis luxurians FD-317 M1]|uniref:Uncharacterized protein n=1 Tax=Collybiopsis luxurians FD-317 M1 TaxID=944289 RepID=A0A0D0BX18_9AGAR|nr:hypothetical protein GYMLUDRAFT_48863 [Collybiopsis luxurians FD-317 M1]